MSADLEFVRKIQIDKAPVHPQSHRLMATPSATKAAAAEGPAPGATVAGNQIVVYEKGVTAQQAADISDSCLLAQLVANKKYDSKTQPEEWYSTYEETLGKFGWQTKNFTITKYKEAQVLGSVDKTLLAFLSTAFDASGIVLFTSLMTSLSNMGPSSKPLEIFNMASSSASRANFQIGAAQPSGADSVALTLGVFTFNAPKNSGRILWFSWGKDKIEFYAGSQTITLNSRVYAIVRDEIIKKLGEHAKTSLADLDF